MEMDEVWKVNAAKCFLDSGGKTLNAIKSYLCGHAEKSCVSGCACMPMCA